MRLLLAALGDNVKPAGKDKWIARCPAHNDKDFAMSIKLNYDNSVMAHCFACGANGLALYRSLGLDLDELFGNKAKNDYTPQYIQDQYTEDKFFLAIYKADVAKGVKPSYLENRKKKLVEARLVGIKNKYKHII